LASESAGTPLGVGVGKREEGRREEGGGRRENAWPFWRQTDDNVRAHFGDRACGRLKSDTTSMLVCAALTGEK
jgi:hypothetical protein